jgi:hypothetical protein
VPTLSSFEYAVLRIVPRVEREEFINAGVIVFCLERKFLRARVEIDEDRIHALWSGMDLDHVRDHLEAFRKVAEGAADGGPVAALSIRQRFHWLVAPRSTVIQVSPVHAGMCEDPDVVLDDLFQKLVPISTIDRDPSPSGKS